ncbi:MAG: ribonuclease HI family protein [Patescibacteria group bacterium]
MTINTDGGSRGNPGPGACGAILKDRNENVVAQKSKFLGICTNNEAEYQGLILGLETALEMGADSAEVLMDSELVIKQLKGEYRVKNAKLSPLYQKVKELEQKIGEVSYFAVPREQNKLADAIVNKVLDEQTHA